MGSKIQIHTVELSYQFLNDVYTLRSSDRKFYVYRGNCLLLVIERLSLTAAIYEYLEEIARDLLKKRDFRCKSFPLEERNKIVYWSTFTIKNLDHLKIFSDAINTVSEENVVYNSRQMC